MYDWNEYDDVAVWCAKRNFTGDLNSLLPTLLSSEVFDEIKEHPEEFKERVKDTAYMLSRENDEE